ncbi:hypothetical protein GCM10009733_088790 [Nonomuraea maheshkhaliensis]|uniref:Uncharacterized protein n=1 Tax=Nonomuraea maheshkhaliensis TaxID=419590 RepID=A0ABN2GWS5_9ACTN
MAAALAVILPAGEKGTGQERALIVLLGCYLVAGMATPPAADLVLLALIAYVARDVIQGPVRQ